MSEPSREQWHYAVDGVRYGPVSRDDLQRFLAGGQLKADDPVWTDGMPEWIPAGRVEGLTGEVAVTAAAPFFAVGPIKMIVMLFATFGVYELYWFYKQWSTIRKRTGEDMWPVARAIFPIFFFHELVKEVNEQARAHGIEELGVGWLTALFVLFTITWRLPEPFDWLAFLTIIPMAFVQMRIEDIHEKAAPLADRNSRIRRWNWLAVLVGLPLFAFAVWLSFTEG